MQNNFLKWINKVNNNFANINTLIFIMTQITQAVKYLSNYSIVHLDIKPENVLLSNNHIIKLIDFGESVILN